MQRNKMVCGAVLVVATLVAGVGWYALRERRIERLFGGSANIAIVARPARVEAYRIGRLPERIYWQDAAPADYPIIGGPVVLADSIAADVSNALLSPNTYIWHRPKACIPAYGIQFSFIRNSN